jgi:cell division protein FtsQ
MPFPIKRIQTQSEKVIDYQYIRNLKNKEVRKSRFKRSFSQSTIRLALIVIFAGELLYLGYYGVQALKMSPVFFLNHIEITGTHQTSPDEIRKYIQSNHTNALIADLTSIKLGLENHPWIKSAVIWRELPGTIRIHLTERVPVALVLAGNLHLVDEAGRVIDVFQNNPEHASLPVITGIKELSNEGEIRRALEFVNALSQDREILKTVSEIHYYDSYNTILYLKGMPFGLFVSKDDILPMIKKFLAYSEVVKKSFSGVKVIDLRYQGQIILKDVYREQL